MLKNRTTAMNLQGLKLLLQWILILPWSSFSFVNASEFSQRFRRYHDNVLNNNNVTAIFKIASVIECASHCVNHVLCRGFSFASSTGVCQIKDTLPECSPLDLEPVIPGTVYFNHRDIPCTQKEISLVGLPASAISIHHDSAGPEKAIDGDTRTNYYTWTCTHTANHYGSWWMVDLSKTKCIREIVIYNRGDCCGERLEGAVVRIGMASDRNNPTCGPPVTMAEINTGPRIAIPCDLCGRFISVHLPSESNNALNICEVQAYVDECSTYSVLPSCAAIKYACYAGGSGRYLIDPDGADSGVDPFTVQCDMNTGVTLIGHNKEVEFATPIGNEPPGSVVTNITYAVSMTQIAALIEVSAQCEQYIKYRCHKSYYTKDDKRNVWWVSRDGDMMINWGGVPTGTAGCSCNLGPDLDNLRGDGRCGPGYTGPGGGEGVCLTCCSTVGWCGDSVEHCERQLYRDFRDPSTKCISSYILHATITRLGSACANGKICNCSANDAVWRYDEGVLTDKSKLPVIRIHSGDTGDAGEEGIFTLGPLKCSG